MKKLVLILIVIASIVCLSGCGSYAESESHSESYDTTVFVIREPLQIESLEELEEAEVVEFLEESEPIMEMVAEPEVVVAVKDETLQVKTIIPDTANMSEEEYQKWKLQQEYEEARKVAELKKKKEEGDRLNRKEQIKINDYEHNIRQLSVEKNIEVLDEQSAKLDSLLKEKEKK